MSGRERTLVILTAAVVIIAAAVLLVPEDFSLGGGLAGGQLDQERSIFRQSLEQLQQGPELRRAYRRVEAQFPERIGNRSPDATFTDELTRMLKEKGERTPRVKPATRTYIDDVEDYYYIDLELEITGTVQKMVDLLIDFQRTGLLIKTFDLDKRTPDRTEIVLKVTVSRLARMDEEEQRRRNRRGRLR